MRVSWNEATTSRVSSGEQSSMITISKSVKSCIKAELTARRSNRLRLYVVINILTSGAGELIDDLCVLPRCYTNYRRKGQSFGRWPAKFLLAPQDRGRAWNLRPPHLAADLVVKLQSFIEVTRFADLAVDESD